jgi:hypothetical protein
MRRLFLFLGILHCIFLHAAAQQKSPATQQGLAAGRQEFLLWPTAGAAGQEKVRIAESGDHVVSNIQRPSIIYYPAGKGKATEKGGLTEKGMTTNKGEVRKMRTFHEMRRANDQNCGSLDVPTAPIGGGNEGCRGQ